MKKHSNAQRGGLFGNPECGEKNWYSFSLTHIPNNVTCKRCKKTEAFKKALSEQKLKDGDKK